MSQRRSRPTLRQVADAAGVSVMTASYAYSQPERVAPATAAKVRAAAEQLGYPGPHPGARSLRRGRVGSLGVILGERLTYAFDDPQAARFLAGVAEVCAAEGVGLTLVPITGAADDVLRVNEAVVDGFVVWTTSDDDPVLDAVAASGLPAVVHAGPTRRGLPVVGIDDRAAAAAIGRLAFAGATRPAVLSFPANRGRAQALRTGPPGPAVTYPVTRHRWNGFLDAWRQAGGAPTDLRIAVCPGNATAYGETFADELFRGDDPPDAIAAMSDELALGALRAASRTGRAVPDAVAITGWDDSDAAEPAGLTTLRQSLRDQGKRCAYIALGLREPSAEQDPPSWQIIERTSTRTAELAEDRAKELSVELTRAVNAASGPAAGRRCVDLGSRIDREAHGSRGSSCRYPPQQARPELAEPRPISITRLI